MAEDSKISWTDHTFNPWWGCIEVSPACDNCYARTFAKRIGLNVWGQADVTERRFFADKHWSEPLKWDRKAADLGERRRVFCASMADIFERNDDLDPHRARLWALIEQTPNLDWLLLTKRPQNILGMIPHAWIDREPHNVWYGTTVENQHYAELRIPLLLQAPAAVLFLSCEPLLGPVDLSRWLGVVRSDSLPVRPATPLPWVNTMTGWPPIDWVITGGESGPKARPTHPQWLRDLRDQCAAAGVAYHFKQWGEYSPERPAGLAPGTWAGRMHTFKPDGTLYSGRGHDWNDPGMESMYRVGVKASGHLLDGVEHQAFPEVRTRDY
jgi:protein gp37